MKAVKYLFRNINPINIILAVAVIFFADYMVMPFSNSEITFTPPAVRETNSHDSGAGEKPAENKPPSPSDYTIIAEQNLFHPDRIIPVNVVKAEAPPLPKPDFVLYGTLMSGDVNVAYMEDKKTPMSTPGREKRQTAVRIGDSISGFTLKKIDSDKVVLQRGEEQMIVYLEDSQHPKAREGIAQPSQQQPPAQQRPAAPPAATSERPSPRRRFNTPPQAQQGTQQQPTSSGENSRNQFLDALKQIGKPAQQ